MDAVPCAVTTAKLGSSGLPIVVLSNGYAYAYQPGMGVWACVADDEYLAAMYSSSMAWQGAGELSALSLGAAGGRPPSAVLPLALGLSPAQQVR